jgi:hypothetical protein
MNTRSFFTIALAITLCLSAASYQGQAQEPAKKDKNKTIAPAASNPVIGSGTPGRISKWTGVDGSNSFSLGNSNIFEDKFGKIGIGTTTPTSLLTIQGMVEITLGGLKFPDGTLQTTAGIASVARDASLKGNGTVGSPLGIANGGIQPIHLANGVAVRSLNGLTDSVSLAAGANITITPSGNTLTIAATNALTGVARDTTLKDNGTAGSPLGVAVPLVLSGSAGNLSIIQATNIAIGGGGVEAKAGESGTGVDGRGGDSTNDAGTGVIGRGGDSSGTNFGSDGGEGMNAYGGSSVGGMGGNGIFTQAGSSMSSDGGVGVIARGGGGSGAGNSGGIGLVAVGGVGNNGAADGPAGFFNGRVQITGTLSKGGGSFKIDHPLDPENKYLYHSFVESPEMMNIYNGNITTNENGEATVTLPDYFDALNRDFRYQLTVIGTFAQAIVAEKIKGNRFVIKTNASNVEVSWQVTGVRQDAFANKNRIPIEEAKPEVERGYYLHPEAFNQSEEKSINWARNPEMMQQLKQRLEAEQMRKRQPNQR